MWNSQDNIAYRVVYYITFALVYMIPVVSSLSTSTGIQKFCYPCFTELSYFLKSKNMLEAYHG